MSSCTHCICLPGLTQHAHVNAAAFMFVFVLNALVDALQNKTNTSALQVVNYPAKPSRLILPSTEKADIPAARPVLKSVISPQKGSNQERTFPSSPQKISNQERPVPSSPQKSSLQGKAFPSSPQKAGPISSTSVPQSPLKTQALVRGPASSPQKPELRGKPAASGPPGESC